MGGTGARFRLAVIGLWLAAGALARGLEPGCGSAEEPPASDFIPPAGRGCPLEVRGGPCGKRLLSARSADGLTFTRANRIITDQGDVPDLVVDHRGWIYLYYVGTNLGEVRHGLALAISRDAGETWVHKNVILSGFEGMSDPVDPDVQVLNDGTFRLYVTASEPRQPAKTWYAEGSDGIRFERRGLAFDPPGEPLDPSTIHIDGTWHIFAGGATRQPGANWHGTSPDGRWFAFDEEKFFLKDGRAHAVSNLIAVEGGYRLYAFTHGAERIINSFFSADGLSWMAEPGARLEMDSATDLESGGVKDAAVVRLADGRYFMVYVTEIQEAPTPLGPVTGAYLMSFHACDAAAANCRDPRNHRVYLAQSDDGTAWGLVPGWPSFPGSVPDVIRRGETVYLYAGGFLVRCRLGESRIEQAFPVRVDGLESGFVDPSLILDAQGRLVLFFLHGRPGSDPAGCPPGLPSCVNRFGSATEVRGSDGTLFALDAGDRLSVTLGEGSPWRSASDPDVFFDGEQYVMYVSHGPSISVWVSPELRGSYRKVADLNADTGGVPAGHFDPATRQYWTYAHASRGGPSGAAVIRRAVHAGFARLLTEQDWLPVLTAADLGWPATTSIESPGFTVNRPEGR